jgi:hypothetical protein
MIVEQSVPAHSGIEFGGGGVSLNKNIYLEKERYGGINIL